MSLVEQIWTDDQDLPPEFTHYTADEIRRRSQLLDNQTRMLKDETARLTNDIATFQEKVGCCIV